MNSLWRYYRDKLWKKHHLSNSSPNLRIAFSLLVAKESYSILCWQGLTSAQDHLHHIIVCVLSTRYRYFIFEISRLSSIPVCHNTPSSKYTLPIKLTTIYWYFLGPTPLEIDLNCLLSITSAEPILLPLEQVGLFNISNMSINAIHLITGHIIQNTNSTVALTRAGSAEKPASIEDMCRKRQ